MADFEQMSASQNWKRMVEYVGKKNSMTVVFIYADQDGHESEPTLEVYLNKTHAEVKLGFIPTIVYYQFIDHNTKTLLIPKNNRLEFRP